MYKKIDGFSGKLFSSSLFMLACAASSVGAEEKTQKPLNVLLITADDLRAETLGCFGGEMAGISPNIDKLAKEGMSFKRAYVNAAICMPSRIVLGTGLYGHNSGAMGFMQTRPGIPTAMGIFQKAGYLAGILSKVRHSTPNDEVKWDYVACQKDLGDGRNPDLYYKRCMDFFNKCKKDGKPFYFMVNSNDPHRPFQVKDRLRKGAKAPSRYYTPEESAVPPFLPDLPGGRRELSTYYNSVRRLDDTVGMILKALDDSGFAGNTIVTFLSDNGISMPFAKCNVYFASNHTPWIVRWPGAIKPGSVDNKHFIAAIDFLPTVLDAAHIPHSNRMDGRSFVPLLKGEEQSGRDMVYTQIDSKAGGGAFPMRAVETEKYVYIYNPWSTGKYYYSNANEGKTFKAMIKAGQNDKAIAERVHMFRYRVPEELYDIQKDPGCLNNLVDNPEYKNVYENLTKKIMEFMRSTNDPLLKVFIGRNDKEKSWQDLKSIYGRKLTGADKTPGSRESSHRKGKHRKKKEK